MQFTFGVEIKDSTWIQTLQKFRSLGVELSLTGELAQVLLFDLLRVHLVDVLGCCQHRHIEIIEQKFKVALRLVCLSHEN